jgi:hypothetical protein
MCPIRHFSHKIGDGKVAIWAVICPFHYLGRSLTHFIFIILGGLTPNIKSENGGNEMGMQMQME